MSLRFDARLRERGFDIALAVADGETLAVLGPNGAGKSTLLGLLAGLVRPDDGNATLGERILFDFAETRQTWLASHRRGVALLAQEPLLFPHLSVRANVAFGPRSTGASRSDAAARAEHWLAETETLELADRKPGELSGGQAQRVAIARALAAEPQLLLLDEPLSALDVAVAPTIRRMLRRVIADRTTIVVTHDPLDAYLLSDRVVVVGTGSIVEEGPTRAVLERPRAEFTAQLAGVSLLTGRRTASGLITDDGVAIIAVDSNRVSVDSGAVGSGIRPSGDVGVAPTSGARVTAALRPSAVRVDLPGNRTASVASASVASEGTNVLHATVRDLEPHGDLVRVRTEWLSADVTPGRVADLDLAPGTRVVLSFSATDVDLYPA
ncbi:sulfate/molybdate ABC transporter ATP-binding protein [Diaminobutyricibacter sp. McL0608]|uniref:sulfate/molybdate ABC transporter ATP-binding protein n=1 Tax=Leifsonia sp. McL0608 TaxID=3143537 RepID=UPI0031F329AD